jgi:hypothetical protein
MTGDLWEVRTLHGGLSLELCGGDKPGLFYEAEAGKSAMLPACGTSSAWTGRW